MEESRAKINYRKKNELKKLNPNRFERLTFWIFQDSCEAIDLESDALPLRQGSLMEERLILLAYVADHGSLDGSLGPNQLVTTSNSNLLFQQLQPSSTLNALHHALKIMRINIVSREGKERSGCRPGRDSSPRHLYTICMWYLSHYHVPSCSPSSALRTEANVTCRDISGYLITPYKSEPGIIWKTDNNMIHI